MVTATAVYNPAVPQAGATMSITLKLNGGFYKSVTGTTNSNGSVSFTVKNAPSGTYQSTVTGVSAAGLTWDLATPVNSFVK